VKREGIFAPNGKLASVEWLARGAGIGPESILFDESGHLITGYTDGRIVRMRPDGSDVRTVALTGGRPLGLSWGPRGAIYVADAERGLLRVEAGKVEALATEHGGRRFGFTDDLDVGAGGLIYFSDASWKFGIREFTLDVLEHRPNGRLLAWSPGGGVELLAGDIYFANGVQLHPDGHSVLVNEMANYRVLRHWVAGPKRGRTESFADGLPGFPDNLTISPDRKRFWVALPAPRHPVADRLAGWPGLRRAIARLPRWVQPKPQRHAQIVALDLDGRPVAYLDHDAAGAYAPISSVREHGGWLYLGSYERDAIGRIAAP
jgi:sugar lactone lactonase YvrE